MMKFKPSNVKLNKSKQSEISTAVLLLTDSPCHHFPVKTCRYCQMKKCWFWVILWCGVTLHHLLPFHHSKSILPFWWAFFDDLSLPTATRHFQILISQNPHNPKFLFFSWHVAEWAVRFFFSEQLGSTRIPLCLKLVGLVFASLTKRIHTTIWALFVWWWFASNY